MRAQWVCSRERRIALYKRSSINQTVHLPSLVNLIPFPPRFFYENLDSLLPTITNISYHWHCTTWSEDSRRQTSVEKATTWQKSFEKLQSHFLRLNLPFLSKILEKVVLHKLLSHLQENNLNNPFQSAYRSGHSTETILLSIVNDILSALDNDNISVLLSLELSAAFDTIDHQIHHHHSSYMYIYMGHSPEKWTKRVPLSWWNKIKLKHEPFYTAAIFLM